MTDELLCAYRSRLPLKHLTNLCGAVRTSHYRRLKNSRAPIRDARRAEPTLLARMQEICEEETGYGYRRVTMQLQHEGHNINHKRVLRLMRQERLLCQVHPRFTPPTTDSQHSLKVYPNLLKTMDVGKPNQAWVSDITYVPCGRDRFGYLAVVLDAGTRRCIGWSLERYLDTRLTLQAVQQALKVRQPPRVHHSDRGRQYASQEYTQLLKAHKVRISMSRSGNPYDNAVAESFFKTLKTEEVYLQRYDSLQEARRAIAHYIENRYNRHRLHSSLGYMTPRDFETTYYKHRINTRTSRKSVSA
jgi:transposase InsO family protein